MQNIKSKTNNPRTCLTALTTNKLEIFKHLFVVKPVRAVILLSSLKYLEITFPINNRKTTVFSNEN
jgi:hypothetical protein